MTVNGEPVAGALDHAMARLPHGAPIVVMIHGYKHSPLRPENCPHRHVLALKSQRGGRSTSWPQHMGFGRGAHDALAIGFGWHARGTIWDAYWEAQAAGLALARVIGHIALRHGRPVHLFAHSLGARVSLAALRELPAGSVGRVVMLAAAEFSDLAAEAVASPAGARAEYLNVTSRENLLFDGMFEWLLQTPWASGRSLGRGIGETRARWVNLAIDDPATRDHLARLGHRIRPPRQAVCHWSGYLRPGMFSLYRAFLTDPAPLPLHALRVSKSGRTRMGGLRPPGRFSMAG